MINLDQELKTLEGKPIKSKEEEGKEEVLTLKKVITRALVLNYKEEVEKKPEEMLTRYELAKKIHESKDIKLSSEEKVMIKDVVFKCYGTLILGRVHDILEKA